jgi:TM2 domain-containing membrane protein YozV
LYLLTGGMWGMGWLVDGIQLSGILQQYNNKEIPSFSLVHAYLFMLPPFGILGFHHYYCHRKWWGLLYSLTLGCFLMGWIVDFVRIPFLVSRSDAEINDEDLKKKYYMDDAYVLWLSLGLFGFHQFYLKRYRWGVVYALTLGLFGFGWIVDAFKIPQLVRQLNIDREEEEDISNVVSNFHKRKESMTIRGRINESYSRFDDVMQKQNSESPTLFTVQRRVNGNS